MILEGWFYLSWFSLKTFVDIFWWLFINAYTILKGLLKFYVNIRQSKGKSVSFFWQLLWSLNDVLNNAYTFPETFQTISRWHWCEQKTILVMPGLLKTQWSAIIFSKYWYSKLFGTFFLKNYSDLIYPNLFNVEICTLAIFTFVYCMSDPV